MEGKSIFSVTFTIDMHFAFSIVFFVEIAFSNLCDSIYTISNRT